MQLIPEWHPVDAVILAWPNAQTDWATWLDAAQSLYLKLIDAINNTGSAVILLCRDGDIDSVRKRLKHSNQVLIISAEYNDTWVRDYGFLTCFGNGHNTPIEFVFNGWGKKFDATKDNLVNQRYLAKLCSEPLESSALVAEGGALEIDEQGHLLSTASCLFNPQRNGAISTQAYQNEFSAVLGHQTFTIFENGHLQGDDTDGHIDTLVRFTPTKGIVVQACENRPEDSHYTGLAALVEECRTALAGHDVFTLPLPSIHNDEGDRLPASYANFLLCNDHVLAPVYGQAEDRQAIEVLTKAYPNFEIVPIDCSVLIQQYGSLHCITMQVPTNTLKASVINQFKQGVSFYEAS